MMFTTRKYKSYSPFGPQLFRSLFRLTGGLRKITHAFCMPVSSLARQLSSN